MEVNGKRVPFLNEGIRSTAAALSHKKDMRFANGGRAKPTTKMPYALKPAKAEPKKGV